MENKIKIEVLYETRDYWRSYFAYYFGIGNIFYWFFTFFAFGLFLAFFFLGKQTELPDFVNVILFSFQFTLLYGFVMSYFSVKNGRRNNVGECEYIFSETNVKVATRFFSSETDWIWFYRAKETGGYFFLYNRSNQIELLPKRFFDAGQIENFRNLLRSKLGSEAYLKKRRIN